MGEQGVFLKHGVHLPPVRRNIINPHTVEKHIPGGRLLKTTDDTQGGRLAATAGAEQCEEFLVIDIQVDGVQDDLVVEHHAAIRQADEFFGHYPPPFRQRPRFRRTRNTQI